MANPKSTPAAFRSVLREVLGDAVYERFPFKMRRDKLSGKWEAFLYEAMVRVAPSVGINDLEEVQKLFVERYGVDITYGLYAKFNGEGRWVVRVPMLDLKESRWVGNQTS